jgi:hypothetical protein
MDDIVRIENLIRQLRSDCSISNRKSCSYIARSNISKSRRSLVSPHIPSASLKRESNHDSILQRGEDCVVPETLQGPGGCLRQAMGK